APAADMQPQPGQADAAPGPAPANPVSPPAARTPAPATDMQVAAVPRQPQPGQADAAPGPGPASPAPPATARTPPPAAEMQAVVVPPRLQPAQAESTPAIAEPEMIPVAGGTLRMGSNEDLSEQPIHSVKVGSFLIAKYPVTVRQWRACVAAKACSYAPDGNDDAPVGNVSWDDAQQFAAWLSQATHRPYRLPSEAEWEYAARGGTSTRYWWGDTMKPGLANCKGCNGPHDGIQPAKVGALPANPFGLNDIGGGLAEWVEDCWHKDYHNAPADGSAWHAPDCRAHVLRGGSWRNDPSYVRPASRDYYDASVRYPAHGVRLARSP
ncbi:formylglycine-generating enzyme family protein, partial [Limobrevibacterium gyesilva]